MSTIRESMTGADRQLAERIATTILGWKWMAFTGCPMHGHPEYPNEVLVRQFFSPLSLANPQWIDFLARRGGKEATGTEPLAHCYVSIEAPSTPFTFTWFDDWDAVVAEMERRRLTARWHWAQEEAELHVGDLREALVLAVAIVGG